MNRDCVEEKIRAEFDSPLFLFAKEKLIEEATDGILDIFTACGKQEPPPPPLLPKMKKFEPYGPHSLIFDGGDNGITAKDSAGGVWNIIGDIFVGGDKYGTAYFYLSPGKDPMVSSNWIFRWGTGGKCYGAICIGMELYTLQTPSGSTWEGSQNCSILRFSDKRKSPTLQSKLYGKGVNWFFVQKPKEWKQVQIGCVRWVKQKSNEFKTPVRIWQGFIDDIDTFKPLGICGGLVGPRREYCTTCSITYIEGHNQLIAYLGDWTTSIIYQFVADSLMGPWKKVDEYWFKPPMKRHKKGGQWSGCFTATLFKLGNQWYMCWSGHGHEDDDKTFIIKVRAVLP